MLVLPVSALGLDYKPAGGFDEFDNVSDFHPSILYLTYRDTKFLARNHKEGRQRGLMVPSHFTHRDSIPTQWATRTRDGKDGSRVLKVHESRHQTASRLFFLSRKISTPLVDSPQGTAI
jgi:hypothetical protein